MDSEEKKPTREELRKRLREKIKNKGNSEPVRHNKKLDIETELLKNGIDDPTVLNMAKSISKNPKQAMSLLKNLEDSSSKEIAEHEDDDEEEELPPSMHEKEESDEELPPSLTKD